MDQEYFQQSQFERLCSNPMTFWLEPSFSPPLQPFWRNCPHIFSSILSPRNFGFNPCHSTKTDGPCSNSLGEISGQGSVPTATLCSFSTLWIFPCSSLVFMTQQIVFLLKPTAFASSHTLALDQSSVNDRRELVIKTLTPYPSSGTVLKCIFFTIAKIPPNMLNLNCP